MKISPILASTIFLFAQAQDDEKIYLDFLNRFNGNKIVLIGDWKKEDINIWNKNINSEDLSGYDLKLLGRHNSFLNNDLLNTFDVWVCRQSGSMNSRWVVLDASNKVITSGKDIPDTKSLSSVIENFGIKSTLVQLRAFLREHPDHIDARADLLKELRRRALLAVNDDLTEDLDKEKDLMIWGLLAREFDLAMNMSWIGFKLDFFRPNDVQPEKFSPLMKAVFRKNIGRVENLLREFPTNENLWDIWAWMARTLGNEYQLFQFVKSINSFSPNYPSPKVAVFLTSLAKSKRDWDSVIRFARLGRNFERYIIHSQARWSPGMWSYSWIPIPIPGYPEESSYYPLLEALLKLGKIEEANDVFDELISISETNNAQSAAAIARSNGFEELSEIWSKGARIKQVPFINPIARGRELGKPAIIIPEGCEEDVFQQMRSLIRYNLFELLLADWSGNDFHWALIDADGLLVELEQEQVTQVPTLAEFEQILKDKDIKTEYSLAKEYLQKNPDDIEALMVLGKYSIFESDDKLKNMKITTELDSTQDEAIWHKTVSIWNKILSHDHAIYAVPDIDSYGIKLYSPSMKLLSKRYLPKIETALRQSPSSKPLWKLWIFLRIAGDNEKDFESLLDSIESSPMDIKGSVPPLIVLDMYYKECVKNNQWSKIAKILKEPWDRVIAEQLTGVLIHPGFGDYVAFPLIEALLQMGRRQDADETFNVWLDLRGAFSKSSELIELAKTLAGEKFAEGWSKKLKESKPRELQP